MDAEKPRKPRAPRKGKADSADATAAAEFSAMSEAAAVTEAGAVTEVAAGTEVAAAPDMVAVPSPAATADTVLRLNASLEIKDVENVHRQFLAMLDRGPSITVDISHVAAMDTAGVQLVLAFQGEAVKRGIAIDYSGQSTAFTHALTAVGLSDSVRHVASRD